MLACEHAAKRVEKVLPLKPVAQLEHQQQSPLDARVPIDSVSPCPAPNHRTCQSGFETAAFSMILGKHAKRLTWIMLACKHRVM
jgi:hypothetical protein